MRWPNARTVREAVQVWARQMAQIHSGVLRIGYFGSYARGDWGVGSDVDLVAIVERSDLPFERRPVQWDTTTTLPVPADLLVYVKAEWDKLQGRFKDTLEREAIWVYSKV